MEPGTVAVVLTLVLATLAGALWVRANGRFTSRRRSARTATETESPGTPSAAGAAVDEPLGLPEGVPLGERATLLQFSSAFCAPCRSTRRVLADVATAVPGVQHVEVDAESHLELVRRWGVLRTPTTVVLDGAGREVSRAPGVPRKEQVLAALAAAVSDSRAARGPRRP